MKCRFYIVIILLCFKFNYLIASSNHSLILYDESRVSTYVFAKQNSIANSDLSVELISLNENIQSCGPEQKFKIVITNNSSQDSKSINGILFELSLPASYTLTNNVSVKMGGISYPSNSVIENLNNIKISTSYILNPSSSIEVIFGATISCNFNLKESISLVTFYNNENNQTLIANNNVNSQLSVSYSRSDYQIINFTKNQNVDRLVEIVKPLTFKDLNYQIGNRVNKLKLIYTYPINNVQLTKLKVKKLDGTFLEIPYNNTTNSPLVNQGGINYTTSSFVIDANSLNIDFIPETVEMFLVYQYIGCTNSNVIYDLKQYCSNGDECAFKSNLASVNELITINSGLPTFNVTYIQEKSKKADNCDRTGKYRYSITNTNNQNLSAYSFSPNYGNMKNIKNVEIFYVYNDNSGNEQFYKWNGNYDTDIDGSGVGLDLMVDPTSNNGMSFLAPGKTIQIEYRYELVDLCSNSDLNLNYQLQFWAYFYNNCRTSYVYPLNYIYNSSESITNRSISGPSDVVENTTTSFFYNPGYTISSESGLIESCNSRNYEVKFKIPGTASIENVKYNNLVISTTNWYITNESGIRYLIITHPTSNVGNNGTYEIQLKSGDCSTATSQNLEFELFTYCGTETCRRSLCKVSKLTYFHSNQCGNSGCFNTNGFSFKRSTFGWKVNRTVENNMYYTSDLAVRATENDGVDTSKVYTDDNIKYHLKGIATSKCGDNLVAKLKYTSNFPLFEVNSGQFLIKNASGSILYTLNVNLNQITLGNEGAYQTIIFTAPLTNISSLTNVILDFQSDIHVRTDVVNGKYLLEDVRGEFLFKNQDFIYGKDSWGKSFTVLSEINQYYSNTSYSLEPCKNKVVFGVEASSSNLYGEVDFTNEFRPVSHFVDEQTITIPVDFDYVPHSLKLGIVNQNDMSTFYFNDLIKYYPTDKYSIIENYDPVSKILKIKINNSPLLLNDNKSILVGVFDIKSLNCYSNWNGNNQMLINYSRRDYAYVNNVSIDPGSSYKQSAAPHYLSYLGEVSFGFNTQNNYSKPYNKEKVSWDYTDYIQMYNYSGRPLGNFWIAFENSLPIKLKFANVKIDQNVGTISYYGENDKYTIVNFGNLPYTPYSIGKILTFDVTTDECSAIPSDMFNLPFKMYMGTSCSSNQYSRPNIGCQISPVDFNISVNNDGTELNKMVLANSNYEQLNPITSSKICDNIYYVATISNSSTSTSVFENVANVVFPKGMELTSVKYRYGSGPITPIAYDVISSNEISINLSTNISAISQGFKSNGGVNNPIDLMFDFKTNCQFSPSDNIVDLNYSYKKYCGEKVSISNSDANLKIEGFENLKNLTMSLLSLNNLQITKLSGDGEVTITVKNTGNISSESSVLNVTLPKELKFVSSQEGTLSSNTANLLNYSIPQLSSGQVSKLKFTINDQYGNKAQEGVRPSVCISEELKITKSLVTNCLNTCNITATLAKDKICIPLPPRDSIPTEISCEDCIESFAPYQGAKYVLSAWVKEDILQNGLISYSGPALVVRFKLQENEMALNPMMASGEIIDGWQRIYQEFTIPNDAQNISVDLINTGNNEVFFDDIRIHPFEANMKSFVYDPVSMKLVAELDENNYATFYEYDEEGALVRVKKETERGIMTIKESRNNTIKK